mgnify:CR=1 FL=1
MTNNAQVNLGLRVRQSEREALKAAATDAGMIYADYLRLRLGLTIKQPAEVREKARKAGLKGGKARASKLSAERRSEIARQGGKAAKLKRAELTNNKLKGE